MRRKVEGVGGECPGQAGVEMRLDYVELNDSDSFEVVGDDEDQGGLRDAAGLVERGVVGGKDEVDRQPHPR
jgi:hypothetical protein